MSTVVDIVALLPIIIELQDMAPKRPDVVKKQKRVQKIVEDPVVQEKLKKKVQTKRAKRDNDKVTKHGSDDTRSLRAKRQKKESDASVSDPGPKSKSVRSRNAKRPSKDAPAPASSG